MRKYDLSIIIDIAAGEESAKEVSTRVEDIITKTKGAILNTEFKGKTDLAVTFKKHTQGYNTRIQYEGVNETIDALNKEFKINEKIIRTLNLSLETVFNPDQIAELTK